MAIAGYPPEAHLLSDLGMDAELIADDRAWVRMRVTPHVTGADGDVRAGVVATLVDVVGGAIAARVVKPDWMATADLSLRLVGPALGSSVEARGSVLRRGRTTLVIEALVASVDDDGRDVAVNGRIADPLAWASMTFAVLPAQNSPTAGRPIAELPSRWSFGGGGLDRPVLDALPVTVHDAAAGRLSIPVRSYVRNSFGAVQGGVMALLAEAAGAAALGTRVGADGDPLAVTDLHVAYLALGKVGPIVSEARVLEPGPDGRCAAVVELRDDGGDGRLTTVATMAGVPATVPVPAGGGT